MNVRLGISRVLTVVWGVIGLFGVAGIVIGVSDLVTGHGKSDPFLIGGGIILSSYVGWRVSIWILNGFFSRDD